MQILNHRENILLKTFKIYQSYIYAIQVISQLVQSEISISIASLSV
jgi:hypothetical protein